MSSVFIGVGSNIGDTIRTCINAMKMLESNGIRIENRSDWYSTEPHGPVNQPWFTNAVLHVQTRLTPLGMLDICHDIENQLGRQRTVPWGPRTIDLDLLLWDETIFASARLLIPHPRMHERRFVLAPLADITPSVQHPVFQRSIGDLLNTLVDPLRIETLKPVIRETLTP